MHDVAIKVALFLGLLSAGWPCAARAQDAAAAPTERSGSIVTLGGFAAIGPKFEGARHDRWSAIPLFDIRDAGAREWLNLPRDGVDISVFETETFRAGLVGNFRWERDTNSLIRGFRHVGDVNLSLEGGAFVEWWPSQSLRTRVEVRQALLGANGMVADLSTDLVTRPLPALTWTAGPRLSLADSTFMNSYYSVTEQQAARSGLPVYGATAGVRSVGAGSMLRYKASDTLAHIGFIEYQRIAQSAYDSPLISRKGSPNQTTFGVGTSVSFSVGN